MSFRFDGWNYPPELGTSPAIVQRGFVNVAASQTDSVVVAAVSGKLIRVLSLVMVTGATATNSTFNSKGSGAGVAISMTFQNGANSGAVLAENRGGWFQTVAGEALTVTTGAGSTTGFQLTYIAF
jgi:hypothetical protein